MAALTLFGGSMGAVAVLQTIIGQLPADFGLAIAVVLHRAADSGRALWPSLERASALPIVEIEDKDAIRPGRVAVAPANYHLLVGAGEYSLSTSAPEHYARPSIDVAIESAARAYGAELVAVILSGNNADGARGVVEAQARGAAIVVQDPASAECPAMPEAAIAAADPVHVLPAPGIAEFLAGLRPADTG